MKTRLCLFACVVGLWAGTAGAEEVIDRIVATVDDEPITLYEVKNFGKGPGGQHNPLMPQEGAAGMSDRDILEMLIMNKLVGKEVEAQGIKAKDPDVDGYIERIKTQNNMSGEQFETALKSQGMSMESYRQQVAGEIERAMLINREIGSRVNVTPEDVERYYKEHNGDYTQAEQVRVRHIFLPLSPAAPSEEEQQVLKQVQDIRNRALAGEDFGALADAHSRGPGAGQGGDLGFFKRGQMAKEIDEVAFALKPGEISQPFRTDAGVHLLKVEERTEAGQQTLDSATVDEIKRKLYNEALQKRYQRWFQEDLRFRHQIENFLTASATSPSPTIIQPTKASPAGQDGNASATATGEEPGEKRGFFRRLLPF